MKYSSQSLRVCYPYENCLGFRLKQLAVLDLHAYVCTNMYAHEPEEMEGRLMIQFAWKLKQSAKSKLCSKLSREVCVVSHYLEGDLTLAPPLVTGWTHWALVLWDGLGWLHGISFGGKMTLGNWLSLHSKTLFATVRAQTTLNSKWRAPEMMGSTL